MHLLMHMVDAIEQVTGRRPNISTAWRWSVHGCGGIRLETVVLGGKRLTTTAMVESFIAATTEAKNRNFDTCRVATTKSRDKQIEKASADLRSKLNKPKRTKPKA